MAEFRSLLEPVHAVLGELVGNRLLYHGLLPLERDARQLLNLCRHRLRDALFRLLHGVGEELLHLRQSHVAVVDVQFRGSRLFRLGSNHPAREELGKLGGIRRGECASLGKIETRVADGLEALLVAPIEVTAALTELHLGFGANLGGRLFCRLRDRLSDHRLQGGRVRGKINFLLNRLFDRSSVVGLPLFEFFGHL